MRGSDFYGIQNIFCEYARSGFNGYFPYAVQHGWQVAATSFESVGRPIEIWVWSERIRGEMSRYYPPDQIRVVGSPYLYLPKIEQSRTDMENDVGVYLLPHSSHFARIGFSLDELVQLLLRLRSGHKKLSVLIYYLDISEDICRAISRLNIEIVVCGGLWSKRFLHNFRGLVVGCSRFYYSSFGSGVLFAQHEGVPVEFVPLSAHLEWSENPGVKASLVDGKAIQFGADLNFEDELGVGFILSAEECSELIAKGRARASWGGVAKKIIANYKNRSVDYVKNVRPALLTSQKYRRQLLHSPPVPNA